MGHVAVADVERFAKNVERLCRAQRLVGGSSVEVVYGRRYAKIVHVWGSSRSSWGWVDLESGDILRGSWKKPDTRYPARGNIKDAGIMDKMRWTGPPYLK